MAKKKAAEGGDAKKSQKLIKKPEKIAKKPAVEKTKPAKPAKAPKPAAAPSGAQISFICSECYEEFFLSEQQMKETVSCPECLHVGKKPQEDFLKTVQLHKGGEKKSLLLASIIAVLALVLAFALIYIRSPYSQMDASSAGSYTMILGGLLALLLIGGIVLGARYEKNRWEVYF